MRNATRLTVSTFGALAGLAGIEHGVGEVLQGNIAPDGTMILSWPNSELLRIVSGEPAMTIVPNLLITGILAILVSLILLVWVTMFIQRKNGGLVLIALCVVLLLVGGGFGPPLLGLILGIAWARSSAVAKRGRRSTDSRRVLGRLWPYAYIGALISWLLMLPGSLVFGYFFGADTYYMVIVPLFAFGLLFLTIFAAFARDARQQDELTPLPSLSR